MDTNSRMAGAGGCQIINAAGTYTTGGETPTLIQNVTAIEVVTGAAAAITALKLTPENGTEADIDALNNIVNTDLTDFAGKVLPLKHPATTITVAANVKLIVHAG